MSSLIFESVDIRLGWGTSLPSHSAPWWGYILCSRHVCWEISMLELHKGAVNTKVFADFICGSSIASKVVFDGELNLLHSLSSWQLLTSHGTGYWQMPGLLSMLIFSRRHSNRYTLKHTWRSMTNFSRHYPHLPTTKNAFESITYWQCPIK